MKLALVTPWFGQELHGGAERLAWDLAHNLRNRNHDVTVLTTCSRSWQDPWNKNSLPQGITVEDGLRISRFRVDHANAGAFREINRHVLATPRARLVAGARAVDEASEAAFVEHNISSSAMLADLVRNITLYDRVIFTPYLYGTTLRGWHIPRERAAIVPCLHDEPYAYLGPVAAMMRGAPLLLFNSVGEFELALHVYGPSIADRSVVVGSAVTTLARPEGGKPIAGFVPEGARYILFVGRNRVEKNLDVLLDAYAHFKALDPESALQLVLAGEETQRVSAPGIVALGPVDDAALTRLFVNARAIAQPSMNESFSRALVEAWSFGRPAIVHADCPATAIPMRETGAGWSARATADWQRVLHHIDNAADDELAGLGARAGEWVERNAAWPSVIANYERALSRDTAPPVERFGQPIAHVLDAATYGDTLTNSALQYDGALRARGWNSVVASERPDPRLGGLVRRLTDIPEGALPVTYLGDGTMRLGTNGAIPIPIAPFFDARRWNIAPDEAVVDSLRDERTTVLSVAPIAAANGQLEIFDLFTNYLTFDFDARLILAGDIEEPEYAERLYAAIELAGLEHRVFVPGILSLPALAAFYRNADLFVSLCERHTTGASLIDAMSFDVPICAIANPSTRSILGAAGVLLTGGRPIQIAALWRVLTSDSTTRAAVIRSQRKRLEAYTERAAIEAFESALIDTAS